MEYLSLSIKINNMCQRCNSTPCTPTCTQAIQLRSCDGCTYTSNTDCVIYTGDRLSFEESTVKDGSSRTLTTLLERMALVANSDRPAKLVNFNVADGPTSYTVVEEDVTKILLLKQTDDGVDGTITYSIVLPDDIAFANKELIFKDIATPLVPADSVIEYQFSIQVQYDWDPVTSSNTFSTLADSTHRTLRLRFLQTSNTSWQWVVLP